MTPVKIVRVAVERKLDMIAITDHNSAENVAAVMAAARETSLRVTPGMEVTTSEEAHVIGLFPGIEGARSLQELVQESLPPGENDEELFGVQVVANEFDEVERLERRLLMQATALNLGQVVEAIHARDGVAIAAHVDRESFSIVSQLGFVPGDLALDALEVSRRLDLAGARGRFPDCADRPFVSASDAHDLGDIAARPTRFLGREASLAELRLALTGTDGRKIIEA
jgi:predicted metal-dependent phosphoesterase TrpH